MVVMVVDLDVEPTSVHLNQRNRVRLHVLNMSRSDDLAMDLKAPEFY